MMSPFAATAAAALAARVGTAPRDLPVRASIAYKIPFSSET